MGIQEYIPKDKEVQLLDHRGQPMAMQDTAHFAASWKAREFQSWNPVLGSADTDLLDELDTMVARATDLVRNHGVASGAIQTMVDNVVGRGFRLSSKPDYVALGWTREQAEAWATKAESLWNSWANSTDCDAGRSMNFHTMTSLTFRNGMVAGESTAIPVWLRGRPGAKWNTAIQMIDPARLDTPFGMNTIRMRRGIEINDYGEPVAYHVRKYHPGDIYHLGSVNEFERIPARTRWGRRKFLHVHDWDRTGQHRGKPILAPVMAPFKMLDHYQRVELQSSVVNAMIAAFIETPMDAEMVSALFGEGDKAYQKMVNSRNNWDVRLEGGAVIPLHPGDKLSSFNPGRPASAFGSFMETCLRQIGTGINMPYELLMKDFSKTNYSSARAALLEAWRFFWGRRSWLTQYWCQPIYEIFLEEAVARGELEAPGFWENRHAYCRARWIGDGRGWVDPVKEAQAAKIRMEIGVSTLEDECAEQGRDWEETLEQRAREKQRMRDLGLTEDDLAAEMQAVPTSDEEEQPGPAPNQPQGGNQ